jgi:hypothetical protein
MNLGQTMGEADKRMTLANAFVCPVIIVSRSRIAKIIFKSMWRALNGDFAARKLKNVFVFTVMPLFVWWQSHFS